MKGLTQKMLLASLMIAVAAIIVVTGMSCSTSRSPNGLVAQSAWHADAAAIIIEMRGLVEVKRPGDSQFHSAESMCDLHVKDIIRTGSEATAVIAYKIGVTQKVMPNTVVEISSASVGKEQGAGPS